MSKLAQLIANLCPEGVEYKKLGEIATNIFRGSGIKRDEITDKGISCVRYGEIYTTYGIYFDKCVSHTLLERVKVPKYFEYGDILFAITGESVEDIAKSTAYTGNDKCLAGGDIVVLKHNQNPKYLAYVLATTDAKKQKSAGKVKSKVVHSSVPAIKEITVPIPPLPVQEEIVRILDNFTELIATLEVELTARKKQYEYYLNLILEFAREQSKGIKYLPLGECIAKNIGGGTPAKSKANYWNGKILWASVKDMVKPSMFLFETKDCITEEGLINSTTNIISKGQIIVATRINPGKMLIAQKDIAINQDLRGLILKDYLSPKYLVYYFKTLKIEGKGTTVKGISVQDLEGIIIPVLPIAEQERIVSILDRFDTLCNDLTIGLPAEIAARQKQYEYYRDQLLQFKP